MFNRLWRRNSPDSTPKTGAGPASVEDRRSWVRVPINRDTNYRIVNGDSPTHTAQVRNVSQGGINLIVLEAIEPGTMLRIDLPHPEGTLGAAVLACVMHCSAEDRRYSIGCTFSSELDDDSLADFGGRREPAASSDQRTWIRFPAHGNAEYQPLPANPDESPRSAEITNISPTGVGLMLEEPIEPGTVLNLGLHRKDREQVYQVLACVVYLGERTDGNWVAGCNFIHELPERDFRQLL